MTVKNDESLSMRSAWQAVMTALLVLKEDVTDKMVRYEQLEREPLPLHCKRMPYSCLLGHRDLLARSRRASKLGHSEFEIIPACVLRAQQRICFADRANATY